MTFIDFINNPTVKLTTPEKNLLRQLEEKYGWQIFPEHKTATNPYNGVSVEVNPVIGSLVEFIHRAYSTYELNGGLMKVNMINVPISFFDRVKYLVLKLDPEAYRKLVD